MPSEMQGRRGSMPMTRSLSMIAKNQVPTETSSVSMGPQSGPKAESQDLAFVLKNFKEIEKVSADASNELFLSLMRRDTRLHPAVVGAHQAHSVLYRDHRQICIILKIRRKDHFSKTINGCYGNHIYCALHLCKRNQNQPFVYRGHPNNDS